MFYLACGDFFVNIGRAILLLSFAKLLYDGTGQLWAFSLIFIVEMVLSFVIPILAGGAIDVEGARKVIRFTSLLSVGICLACAFLVANASMSTSILLATSVGLSIVNPFIKLSVFSVTPELSEREHLEKNNGSLAIALQSGQFIGMVIVAVVLKYFSLCSIFITVSIVYAASSIAYFVATKDIVATNGARKSNNIGIDTPVNNHTGYKDLITTCFSLAPLLILSNFDFASVAVFNLLLAPVVAANYENNPIWLSGLDASFAIGAIIGGILVARQLRKKTSSMLDSMKTQLCFVVCLVVYLLSSAKYAVPLVIMPFGILLSFSTVFWNTWLQRAFPVHMKGRLAGARNLLSSLYIGLVTMLISSAHEVSLNFAIVTSITITLLQAVSFLIYSKRNAPLMLSQ
jgi:MFS family permease